ncbi:MAG: undecaprenyldiphospho-muramoylpentapeptide beta-N-acetylglucosaminyltransferase [Candidatus Goldiibacteriota bacterium]
MKIIFACGGTGGHIYPAVAVAEKLKKNNKKTEVLFIGNENGMEKRIIKDRGYVFKGIAAYPFVRKISFRNIINFSGNIKAFIRARSYIKDFDPDFVAGTGGFVSFPVVLAAQFMGKKTLIHEPNMHPGLANRVLGKRASVITTGFEETKKWFPAGKTFAAGNPVRKGIGTGNRKKSCGKFGLSLSKKTVLIMPGSRAAVNINKTVLASMPLLEKIKDIQLLWMCGKAEYESLKKALGKNKRVKVKLKDFIMNAEEAYSCADAGVMRAGAATLSEIAAVQLPSILVPYPYAAGNHQEKNADVFRAANAAVVVKDSEFEPEVFVKALKKILNSRTGSEIKKNIRAVYKAGGAENIARIITERIND